MRISPRSSQVGSPSEIKQEGLQEQTGELFFLAGDRTDL